MPLLSSLFVDGSTSNNHNGKQSFDLQTLHLKSLVTFLLLTTV